MPEPYRSRYGIDTSRTQTQHDANFGQASPSYGIFVTRLNDPGGGSANYTLDQNSKCLTSQVTVQAKR